MIQSQKTRLRQVVFDDFLLIFFCRTSVIKFREKFFSDPKQIFAEKAPIAVEISIKKTINGSYLENGVGICNAGDFVSAENYAKEFKTSFFFSLFVFCLDK